MKYDFPVTQADDDEGESVHTLSFTDDHSLATTLRTGMAELGVSPASQGSHIAVADHTIALQLIATAPEWERCEPSREDISVFAPNADHGGITWFVSKLSPALAANKIESILSH